MNNIFNLLQKNFSTLKHVHVTVSTYVQSFAVTEGWYENCHVNYLVYGSLSYPLSFARTSLTIRTMVVDHCNHPPTV